MSEITETPNLEGRIARCPYCKTEKPSTSEHLAFFEYNGEGSLNSQRCKCGYYLVAHADILPSGHPGVVADGRCPGYEPRGDDGYDTYYCGCRGWD